MNFVSVLMGILPSFNRRGYFGLALQKIPEIFIDDGITAGILVTLLFILVVLPPIAPAIWVFWATGKSIMEDMVCEVV